MIMSTWLDKPLSIAGRALVRENGRLATKLVDLDRDAALIPNMPIHFNRDINNGYSYNPQVDMLPALRRQDAKGALGAEIAAKAGVPEADVVACDLFLYNRTPASVWGAHEEFFSCPRIDDLECAYTSLAAFIAAPAAQSRERLRRVRQRGSRQPVQAGRRFHAAWRRADARAGRAGHVGRQIRAAMALSFMVSADNAHAVHPNHPEKYDEQNRTFMNGGVVIKHNANQKYTTDAVSDAIFAEICAKAGVPVQHFANRSDVVGGSTLGNIANAHVSMNTVDVGLAQLAMHSSYETAGCADVAYMIRALTAFYQTNIATYGDGKYQLR